MKAKDAEHLTAAMADLGHEEKDTKQDMRNIEETVQALAEEYGAGGIPWVKEALTRAYAHGFLWAVGQYDPRDRAYIALDAIQNNAE